MRFVVLFEIKGIMPMCLIAVLWSHDQLQPMSCSQMELIWYWHVQEYIKTMENETGGMCFFYLFSFMRYYYVEK